jgi:uncharacterized protein YraI
MKLANLHAHRRVFGLAAVLLATLACSLTLPDGVSLPGGGGDPPTVPDDAQDASVPDENPVVADARGPQIVLAAPLDGSVYFETVPVNILARIENTGDDVARIEVRVDDEIVQTVNTPNPTGAPVFPFAQSWIAADPGLHEVSLTLVRNNGDAVRSPTHTIEVRSTDPAAQATIDAAQVLAASEEQAEESVSTDAEQPVEEAVIPDAPEDAEAEQSEPEPTDEPEPTATPEPTDEPEPTATPDTSPKATVLVGANVRTGPSTQFGLLGPLAPNSEQDLLAVNEDGSWYKIQYYNAEGWIFGELVSVENADNIPVESGPPTPTPVPPTLTPVPATATPVPSNVNLVFDGSVSVDPYPPDCGETMTIRVSVRNDGSSGMESNAAMQIRDIHVDSGTVTEVTAPIPQLGAGETTTVDNIFLTVDTNFGTTHRIQVVLDSNSQISENNEDDNASRAEALEYTLDPGDC